MIKIIVISSTDTGGEYLLEGGEIPPAGNRYILEPADEHTAQQRKAVHKLIDIWYKSGLWNYDTLDYAMFRDHVKKDYGEGFDRYQYADDNYNIICVKKIEDIPEHVLSDLQNHPQRVKGVLKSFTRYTKKQVIRFMDNLINAMYSAGVQNKGFDDMIKTMEDKNG